MVGYFMPVTLASNIRSHFILLTVFYPFLPLGLEIEKNVFQSAPTLARKISEFSDISQDGKSFLTLGNYLCK